MSNLTQEIIALEQNRQSIVDAVNAKGGELAESAPLNAIAQAIEALPSGGGDMSKLIDGSITELTIPTDISVIRPYCYYGLNLTEVDVPPNIITLSTYAFATCQIKQVTLHEGLNSIGNFAFFQCKQLQEVTIPASVTSIGTGGQFRGCSSLQRAKFLGTVNIPNAFFQDCTTLEEVDLSNCSRVVTLMGTSAFSNVPKTCAIKIPSALYDSWITVTNWSTLYAQGYNFVAV